MSAEQIAAWQRLDDVASTHRRDLHPEDKDWEKQRLRLHQAAVAYVATCKAPKGKQVGGRVVGTNGQELRGGVTPTFGNQKGVAIEEIETKDLEWYEQASLKSIADPQKRNFREKNQAFLNAVRKELATR